MDSLKPIYVSPLQRYDSPRGGKWMRTPMSLKSVSGTEYKWIHSRGFHKEGNMRMQENLGDLKGLPNLKSAFPPLSAFYNTTQGQVFSSLLSLLKVLDTQGHLPKAHRMDHRPEISPRLFKFQASCQAWPKHQHFSSNHSYHF